MSDPANSPTRPEHPKAPPLPGMMSACQSGGCGGHGAPRRPDPPVFAEVRVDGVEIPPEAIAREIQHHPAPTPAMAWTEAARALAIRHLLLAEAARQGLQAEPEADEAGRFETAEDAVISRLLEREVEVEPVDESACRRFYEANRHRFRTSELFEAAHILFEPDGQDDEAWEVARNLAAATAEHLQVEPSAFAGFARDLSACPSGQQEGSLGQVRRGDLAAPVQQAIEALRPGEITAAPVRSRHGWHVVRLARRIEGTPLPFEVVRAKIADMLEARGWSVGATRYIAELAGRSRVEGVAIVPAEAGEIAGW